MSLHIFINNSLLFSINLGSLDAIALIIILIKQEWLSPRSDYTFFLRNINRQVQGFFSSMYNEIRLLYGMRFGLEKLVKNDIKLNTPAL